MISWAVAGVVIKELYRRKDFYVLFILTALLTLVMGAINIFDDNQVVRYLKEICLLLIWISTLVIAIGAAARQIPSEREHRTIFPLLAKPISRPQLVVGKFLGCWAASGLAVLVFYLFFGLISASREDQLPFAAYFQAATLHWFLLGIVIAATLLGSVVLTTPSANITICFLASAGILLLGRHLHTVAIRLAEPAGSLLSVVYYLIPHLEFFDIRQLIIHNLDPVAWRYYALALGYGAVYMMLFLAVTAAVFVRKPITR